MTYKKIKTLKNLIKDENRINSKIDKLTILHNLSGCYYYKKTIYLKLQKLVLKRNVCSMRIKGIISTCDHKKGDGTSATVSKLSLFGYKLCEICNARVPKYGKKDSS